MKILIIGPSGSGKTHALRTLNPETTVIICCDEKDLPFKGWSNMYKKVIVDGKPDKLKSNFFKVSLPARVLEVLNMINKDMPHIKVCVLDTITMMMIVDYMSRITDTGFQKFNDIAANTYNILKTIDKVREDLHIIVNAHQEMNYDESGAKNIRFKVPAGKLVGEKLEIEAMFTTVLYSNAVSVDGITEYFFETHTNGMNTCKSPEGMFPESKIPNDMKYVLQCVTAYSKGENAPPLPTTAKKAETATKQEEE